MLLRHPEDLHFIAVCLTHGLATPEQIAALVRRQAQFPDSTLGEMLQEEGIISPAQFDAIFVNLVHNPKIARIFGSSSAVDEQAYVATMIPDETMPTASAAGTLEVTAPMDALDTMVVAELTEYGDNSPIFNKAASPVPESVAGSLSGTIGGDSVFSAMDSMQMGMSRGATVSFTRGVREQRPASELIGTDIANHVIEGQLGQGGMGQVFSARQLSLNRTVALKVLPPSLAKNVSFVNRFITEARMLATFTHPNIVQVYDVGVVDGVFYFTMESVKGQSLKDLLKSEQSIPVEVSVNLLKQALRGLDRAAAAGIIHRDIKPGNILIDDQAILKLVDFGLAERGDSLGVLGPSQVVGTPLYIAPEQVANKDVTSKADQYSLGATFFHLLTGRPPFAAASVKELLAKHIAEPCPDPSSFSPDIHPELGAILQKMMAKNPTDRFRTFQELFKALEDFELRHGLIENRASFLSEGLMNIGERSVAKLWQNVALFSVVGIVFTGIAVGLSVALKERGMTRWLSISGDLGATLLMLAFAAIIYIALVRKKLVPAYGNIRVWLQTHIVLALSGFFLSMIHSGNFLNFFRSNIPESIPGGGISYHVVPVIPFLNSLLFTVVIVSGLIGRFIWRDIANQIAADRIQRGLPKETEGHELTLAIFAQKALRNWRLFHYPMAFALVFITIIHIISILYYNA